MNYRVDLHIHTCLSPCGGLEMSPSAIVQTALARGLDAIAVTDHNTTLQCLEIQTLGKERGLKVFAGVEVTTREEAHCLVLFPTDEARLFFQNYLDAHLPHVPNDPMRFGDQVWVNRADEIVGEAPYLLLSALDEGVDRIARLARSLGCLFVAAHVERPAFSLIGQLGFIDPSLPLDAVEFADAGRYTAFAGPHPYLRKYTRYTASDAHYPFQIGTRPSVLQAGSLTFESLRKAMTGEKGYALFAEPKQDTTSG